MKWNSHEFRILAINFNGTFQIIVNYNCLAEGSHEFVFCAHNLIILETINFPSLDFKIIMCAWEFLFLLKKFLSRTKIYFHFAITSTRHKQANFLFQLEGVYVYVCVCVCVSVCQAKAFSFWGLLWLCLAHFFV